MLRIIPGDLSDSLVIELLNTHLTTARAQTAVGSAHALDLAGLQSPDISFWTVWDDDRLVGCGALKRLTAEHGEIKSMHTFRAMRRRGAGSAMLRHIIATAPAQGMSRLSLDIPALGIISALHGSYIGPTVSSNARRLLIMCSIQTASL
jgi:putative acetyltransferase